MKNILKPYRKNVGIVVFNSIGEVITGERIGLKGAWQFPQGGIDDGENLKFAAERELYEELGIRGGEFVYEHTEWIRYDFPPELDIAITKKYKGQIQKWFLYYWDRSLEDCNLFTHEQEFYRIKYTNIENTLNEIVYFKKEVYEKVIKEFVPQIKNFLKKSE